MTITRFGVLLAAAVLVAAGCGAPGSGGGTATTSFAPGDVPDKPREPVTLNIIDVAGNLQLTQGMIDEFAQKNPDIVAKVTYTKATAPELAGKIKAQQQAGRVQIGLVLTGTDGLSAGIEQGLWLRTDDYASKIGPIDYQEPAAKMQELAQGQGQVVTYYPSGPLIEYNPAKVADPPKTAEELLAWAKANPKRFQYARPANSGPGRTFLMGLPYLLGDSDPKNPASWTKTWDYLKELGKYIDYYPTTTTETMKNLGTGTVDIVATTTGWDINPRALGTVPAEVKVQPLEGMHWVTDAHYAVIPKGVSADVVSANIALIKWMLTPQQQAKAYDTGYFYPGPAVNGVTLSMAPKESQDVIAKFGRPEYDQWISQFPKETSLPAPQQVAMFDKWDREVGAGKYKTQ
ncbi:putative spermidine/putrescine transport system substrate-binding protein [Thermocatellispora tengchongensis]|uniref:Putative spermidine/putrescine transport system substrate-binding protein n=1 Tax=Thermocatellispora tengchongensis TaxID=1073253 RepID=A0A840PN52_9ACTN|nr:extracellular solute-binding protein [Thermocatellispora tengchongensis]MBB5139120.1 putative spermidine/putrescine transport system substrate-binding protein [Thermocatellispora tengchongensis]